MTEASTKSPVKRTVTLPRRIPVEVPAPRKEPVKVPVPSHGYTADCRCWMAYPA